MALVRFMNGMAHFKDNLRDSSLQAFVVTYMDSILSESTIHGTVVIQVNYSKLLLRRKNQHQS